MSDATDMTWKHVSRMPNCKLQLTSKYLATTTVFDFGALSHLVFFFSVGLLWEILSTSVSRKKYYFWSEDTIDRIVYFAPGLQLIDIGHLPHEVDKKKSSCDVLVFLIFSHSLTVLNGVFESSLIAFYSGTRDKVSSKQHT